MRSPSKLRDFVERTDGQYVGWKQFLIKHLGIDGGTNDLEKSWLRSKGGTGETMSDLWHNYLNSLGYAPGPLRQRVADFLDNYIAFSGAFYLQEDGLFKYLLEDGSGYYILE